MSNSNEEALVKDAALDDEQTKKHRLVVMLEEEGRKKLAILGYAY